MMDSLPDGYDVANFLGRPDLQPLAEEHVGHVANFVCSYVNGHGFSADGTECEPELASVIISACARLTVNPSMQEQESADGYSARGSLHAFNLVELSTLHRWRRRTA
jgi:hypothetical protein